MKKRQAHPAATGKSSKIKLPSQLLSIIQGEEKGLCAEGFLSSGIVDDDDDADSAQRRPVHKQQNGVANHDNDADSAQPPPTQPAAPVAAPDLMNLMLLHSAAREAEDTVMPPAHAAEDLPENSWFPPPPGNGDGTQACPAQQKHSVTQIVLASQHRFTKVSTVFYSMIGRG